MIYLWIAVALLAAWVIGLHRRFLILSKTVAEQSTVVSTLIGMRSGLLTEEIPKAREELGKALERLDVGGIRKRVDSEERRED